MTSHENKEYDNLRLKFLNDITDKYSLFIDSNAKVVPF